MKGKLEDDQSKKKTEKKRQIYQIISMKGKVEEHQSKKNREKRQTELADQAN